MGSDWPKVTLLSETTSSEFPFRSRSVFLQSPHITLCIIWWSGRVWPEFLGNASWSHQSWSSPSLPSFSPSFSYTDFLKPWFPWIQAFHQKRYWVLTSWRYVFTVLSKNQPLVVPHESSLTQDVLWDIPHISPHWRGKSLLWSRTGARQLSV